MTSPIEPTFQHARFASPGHEIRLLQIDSSSVPGEHISIKLTHLSQPTHVSYAAVSYRWGSTETTRSIFINGRSYLVTESLFVLLSRLQEFQISENQQGIYFWIDAVSIDQQNVEEKSFEVARMGTIYGNAGYVLVWLGPEADESTLAIEQIRKVGLAAVRDGYLKINDYEQWASDLLSQLVKPPDTPTPWGYETMRKLRVGKTGDVDFYSPALRALTSRTYWNRVWMFQECGLARHHTYLCGPSVILGDILEAGLQFYAMAILSKLVLQSYNLINPQEILDLGIDVTDYDNLTPPALWLRATQRAHPKRELFQIVGEFARCNAGFRDPRDRIFATWGFLNSEEYNFQPDYTLPTKDVFVSATEAILMASGTSILALCHNHEENVIADLPSWCPDWSLSRQNPRFNEVNYTYKRQLEHSFSTDTEGIAILRTRGLLLDTITYVTPTYAVPTSKEVADSKESGKAAGSLDPLKPSLPKIRILAYHMRKLYQELLSQYPPEQGAKLFPALLRCLDDGEVTEQKVLSLKALCCRDPIEATIWFSTSRVKPSSEVCSICSPQQAPFATHLDALLCPHLPSRYAPPTASYFNDTFVAAVLQYHLGSANLTDATESQTWGEFFGNLSHFSNHFPAHTLKSTRFYLTQSGDIGQGRSNIAVGDQVHLVGDAWAPLVLRGVQGGRYVECKGETYLDSVYEGAPRAEGIRGTGRPWKRGAKSELQNILESLERKEHGPSPFLELYDLNAEKVVQLNIV